MAGTSSRLHRALLAVSVLLVNGCEPGLLVGGAPSQPASLPDAGASPSAETPRTSDSQPPSDPDPQAPKVDAKLPKLDSTPVPASDATSTTSSIVNPYAGGTTWCRVSVHVHPAKTSGTTMATAYKAAGYDLIFFTDHDYDTQTAPLTNMGLTIVKGEEVSTSDGHSCALGITSFIKAGMSRQLTIDAANAQGGMLQVNHPTDNDVTKADLDGLSGLWGIEVRNQGHPNANDAVLWDSQISQKKKLWGTFSDDAHSTSDVGRGWLMVGTPGGCAQAAVIGSMKAGSFYGSEGPKLGVSVSGKTITVTSDTGAKVDWYKENMTKLKSTAAASDSYTVSGTEVFVRAVVTNSSGKVAMTQPLFLK